MDVSTMKRTLMLDVPDGETPSILVADEVALSAVSQWMQDHHAELNANNHYLQVNPIQVSRSNLETRVRRTAHLMLRAEATSTPHANPDGKVLLRHAVDVTVSWDNGGT